MTVTLQTLYCALDSIQTECFAKMVLQALIDEAHGVGYKGATPHPTPVRFMPTVTSAAIETALYLIETACEDRGADEIDINTATDTIEAVYTILQSIAV